MSKRVEWRILTDDGLLKKPMPYGPHYDPEDINTVGGFMAEKDAVNRLEAVRMKYSIYGKLVLVEFYN